VSVDPITDAADRAKCGYRCDAKAATRDGEPARPRYASSGHVGAATALHHERRRDRRQAHDRKRGAAGVASTGARRLRVGGRNTASQRASSPVLAIAMS